MRTTALICFLVGAFSLSSAARADGLGKATRYLEKAQVADAALRKDEARLRFRHNIELVIRRWRVAARLAGRADRPELYRRARAGEARAWALLAHWSGRASDDAKARAEAEAVARLRDLPAPAPAEAPEPEPEPEAEVAAAPAPEADAPLAADEPAIFDGDEDTSQDPAAIADALKQVLADIGPKLGAVVEVHRPEPEVETQPKLRRSTRQAAQPRQVDLLSIRKVVVDAGHGGDDDGAIGPRGEREADVNLAIAKKLGAELEARLGIEVVYTRTDDTFVSLRDRTRIANRAQADLFVSVHANAHTKRRVHGVETYYLNTTSNRYAQRLARRENALAEAEPAHAEEAPEPEVGMDEDDVGSLPDGRLGQDLRLILADLAMRSATVESRRLAGYVQTSMVERLRAEHDEVKDLGVKHALFYVLLGARMPAVLVETGFISHRVESRRLVSPAYQQHLAHAIASGVARFADERRAVAERLARRGDAQPAGALAAALP